MNSYITNKIKLKKNNKFAAIIGLSPSKGARSPKLWNSAYSYFKKKIKMFPLDVAKNNLKNLCLVLKKNPYFIGGSVTAPYKEEIIKYLDNIEPKAKQIGSVNTIKKESNFLNGYNTDYFGFIETLKEVKINKKRKKILILGSGGAGKACIVATINYFTKSSILIFNRDKKSLIKFLKKINYKSNKIKPIDLKFIKNIKFDLIINSTSVGFDQWQGQNKYFNLKNFTPLALSKVNKIKEKNMRLFLNKNQNLFEKNFLNSFKILNKQNNICVIDIIYQPLSSLLLKIAEICSLKTYNGLKMNLMQAVIAFKIVNNIKNKKKIMKGMNYGK